MNDAKLHDAAVHCPFCGHQIHVSIDASEGDQDYQDECRACGNDIHLVVHVDHLVEKIVVRIKSDDENYY